MFSSVQFGSAQLCSTLCDPINRSTTGLRCPSPIPGVYPNFLSIESVLPSNHLILCHPLLVLHSIFPSIRVFSNESVLPIWWPRYWSFSFSINPSNEYSGVIAFRIEWADLLAVHGTLKSLSKQHSSKASILQLCFLYGPTFTFIHDYWQNRNFDYTVLCW